MQDGGILGVDRSGQMVRIPDNTTVPSLICRVIWGRQTKGRNTSVGHMRRAHQSALRHNMRNPTRNFVKRSERDIKLNQIISPGSAERRFRLRHLCPSTIAWSRESVDSSSSRCCAGSRLGGKPSRWRARRARCKRRLSNRRKDAWKEERGGSRGRGESGSRGRGDEARQNRFVGASPSFMDVQSGCASIYG
jgi:hypothetical protein